MVNSFSFQTAVIASSPPSTVMPAFFFFFCFIAPLLEVCFGMVPVIFFHLGKFYIKLLILYMRKLVALECYPVTFYMNVHEV